MEEYLGKAFSQDYPISPERDAQLEREHKQWVRSLTKEKIAADNRMPHNGFGHNIWQPTPKVVFDECEIVHRYALSMINNEKWNELWNIYLSVSKAYLRYIKEGHMAKADFDPRIELKL